MSEAPVLFVLAGPNGAGKSSIGGAFYRSIGRDYFNPDEVTRQILLSNNSLDPQQANSLAWQLNVRMLREAITRRTSYAFETTLGGNTITALLRQGIQAGLRLHLWYAGLDSPERHLARVAARVARGGHDIPEAKVRERYRSSLLNLIQLAPLTHRLQVFDNSIEAIDAMPEPKLVLAVSAGRIDTPATLDALRATPDWAQPVVARAFEVFEAPAATRR